MALRNYRNGQATTLAFPISALDTLIQVASATSFPTVYPYTLILEPDGALEEVVDVVNGTGTSLTVVRGVDGTTASAHSSGIQVYHGLSARDAAEANAHVNATTNVHGTSGSLVDTASSQSIAGTKNFTGALQVAGSAVVSTAGDQTIAGTKTFSTKPAVTGTALVDTTTDQTVGGAKTFTGAEVHQGTETHSGAETHNGTEVHNGSVTFNGGITSDEALNAPDALRTSNYTLNTDANGFATVSHGAGFTPSVVWAVTTNPSGSFAVFWGCDNITSTQVRLRFMNANGGALASAAVAGKLICVRP